MRIPTLQTLTLVDIARIGVFWDEYQEVHRGTTSRENGHYADYEAAYRVIRGEAGLFDEVLVRRRYEASVCRSFTAKGFLCSFVRINVYDRHVYA